MEQSSKEILVKIINLIKAGDKATALPMLTSLLKHDPDLEQGWYLLGMTLDGEDKKIRAFKQVLKLNPNNEKAKKQLEKLEGPPAPPPQTPAPQKPPSHPEAFTGPSFLEDDAPPAFEPGAPAQSQPGAMQPDFDLPDWMKQDKFDATDHLPQIPEAYEGHELDSEDTPWESDQQDEAFEVPDWAKRSGPPPPGPVISEMDDKPDWLDSKPPETTSSAFTEDPFLSEPEEETTESAFTGYYEEEDQDEALQPDAEESEEYDDEEEVEEGEPEWLRAMVEEEEGSGKGKKKKKKKKKRTKVELSPKEKRLRRRRIFLIAMIFLCSAVGAVSYFFPEEVQTYAGPYIKKYMPPMLTKAAPVTDLLTEGAPLTDLLTRASPTNPNYLTPSPTTFMTPTLPPTWTPEKTLIPTHTPRPTDREGVTPTPSQTSLPLPQEIQDEMDVIQGQVVDIRKLPGPNSLQSHIIPQLKLRLILEDWMLQGNYIDQLEIDQIVYRALGFVNSNYDLVTEALNTRADAIGGFYLPESNDVFVIGTGFYGIEKYVYAHEYAHAIQDASFDLSGLGVYPVCTLTAQNCLAITSLVEGDAELTQEMWLDTYPPELEYNDILRFTPPSTLFRSTTPPKFFEQNALFPYTYGYEFVSYLYDNGGWNAVNRAYQYLPQTTEQILHPEKYSVREAPHFIDFPDLTAILQDGWQIVQSDSLGEWESYLLLAYNDYPSTRRSESEATVAAAGWGGDLYQVLYNAEAGETLLAVQWDWDTQTDSDEFFTSLTAYLSARFQQAKVEAPGTGSCWFLNSQMSCIYRQGKQILWLHSNNLDMLDAAEAAFTDFT